MSLIDQTLLGSWYLNLSQITGFIAPLQKPSVSVIESIILLLSFIPFGVAKIDNIKIEVVTRSRQHGDLGLFKAEDSVLCLKTS